MEQKHLLTRKMKSHLSSDLGDRACFFGHMGTNWLFSKMFFEQSSSNLSSIFTSTPPPGLQRCELTSPSQLRGKGGCVFYQHPGASLVTGTKNLDPTFIEAFGQVWRNGQCTDNVCGKNFRQKQVSNYTPNLQIAG